MKYDPLESSAVAKTDKGPSNDSLPPTRIENITNGSDFPDTEQFFPATDASNEEFYRIPSANHAVTVPDVERPLATRKPVIEDPDTISGLLEGSPLEKATIGEPTPSWMEPAPPREPKKPTSWFKKLLGGR